MIKLSLLFNSSPSKPKSDPKIFPDAPALLQPPPGSSCQVVHLLSAPQLACWMAKGGGTSSLVCDDGGSLLHGELVLVDGCWYNQLQKEQQLVDGLSWRESQLGTTQSRAEKRENAVKKRDFPLLMDVFLWKQVQQSSYKIYDVHINCWFNSEAPCVIGDVSFLAKENLKVHGCLTWR